jgi:hypothetical protein
MKRADISSSEIKTNAVNNDSGTWGNCSWSWFCSWFDLASSSQDYESTVWWANILDSVRKECSVLSTDCWWSENNLCWISLHSFCFTEISRSCCFNFLDGFLSSLFIKIWRSSGYKFTSNMCYFETNWISYLEDIADY